MSKPGERNQEVYLRVKKNLPEKFHDDLDALCDELESDFTTAQDEHDETLAEQVELSDDMESVLTTLKYWFLDVMVHGRPVTDPRKMLRKVEAVL